MMEKNDLLVEITQLQGEMSEVRNTNSKRNIAKVNELKKGIRAMYKRASRKIEADKEKFEERVLREKTILARETKRQQQKAALWVDRMAALGEELVEQNWERVQWLGEKERVQELVCNVSLCLAFGVYICNVSLCLPRTLRHCQSTEPEIERKKNRSLFPFELEGEVNGEVKGEVTDCKLYFLFGLIQTYSTLLTSSLLPFTSRTSRCMLGSIYFVIRESTYTGAVVDKWLSSQTRKVRCFLA